MVKNIDQNKIDQNDLVEKDKYNKFLLNFEYICEFGRLPCEGKKLTQAKRDGLTKEYEKMEKQLMK